jgi:two-component system, CitB family, response regulator
MDIHVVIAEDDPRIAEIQKRFLERMPGFQLVGIAHGLQETRDLVEILQPQLLLLDVQFPTGTGLELLQEIRSQHTDLDVILVTAAKEVNTLREALHCGVFDYILKPLVFERLTESLENYQRHLNRLSSLESVAQQDVDTLLPRSQPGPHSSDQTRLPKGIDVLTLDKVRVVISKADRDYSAEEVGREIGASRATARRYLEYLISTHEVGAEVNYGTVGRPERRYQSLVTG